MKKILPILLFTALGSSLCNAQQRYQKELLSENNLSYKYYNYENNHVDSIYMELPDGYSAYRLFTYDAEGRNTVQKRYQMPKEAQEYLYTDNVYFTYDDKGRVISRKNYNLDFGGKGDFILGGVYKYEYNEDGTMSKRTLYWDEALTRLYEIVSYEYDTKGRLIRDVHSSDQFGNVIEDYIQEYEYDAEGHHVKTNAFSLDYTTGKFVLNSYTTLLYDANGNMIERTDMVEDGTITEKHEYKYDTTAKASETIFPSHFDDTNMLYTCSENIVTEDAIYMRDIKAGKMVYMDTEKWVYGENEFAGINEVSATDGMNLLSLTPDKVVLGNIHKGSRIRVYNEAGIMVGNIKYNDGLNISQLPKGIYMIVSDGSSIKIRK